MRLIKDIRLLMFVFQLEDRHKEKIKSQYEHTTKKEYAIFKHLKSYFISMFCGALGLAIAGGISYCGVSFLTWIGPEKALIGFFTFVICPILGCFGMTIYKDIRRIS